MHIASRPWQGTGSRAAPWTDSRAGLRWPASAPLTITSPGGQVATIVLPGFTGALNLTLTTPAADVDFATVEVMTITYAGLVLG